MIERIKAYIEKTAERSVREALNRLAEQKKEREFDSLIYGVLEQDNSSGWNSSRKQRKEFEMWNADELKKKVKRDKEIIAEIEELESKKKLAIELCLAMAPGLSAALLDGTIVVVAEAVKSLANALTGLYADEIKALREELREGLGKPYEYKP